MVNFSPAQSSCLSTSTRPMFLWKCHAARTAPGQLGRSAMRTSCCQAGMSAVRTSHCQAGATSVRPSAGLQRHQMNHYSVLLQARKSGAYQFEVSNDDVSNNKPQTFQTEQAMLAKYNHLLKESNLLNDLKAHARFERPHEKAERRRQQRYERRKWERKQDGYVPETLLSAGGSDMVLEEPFFDYFELRASWDTVTEYDEPSWQQQQLDYGYYATNPNNVIDIGAYMDVTAAGNSAGAAADMGGYLIAAGGYSDSFAGGFTDSYNSYDTTGGYFSAAAGVYEQAGSSANSGSHVDMATAAVAEPQYQTLADLEPLAAAAAAGDAQYWQQQQQQLAGDVASQSSAQDAPTEGIKKHADIAYGQLQVQQATVWEDSFAAGATASWQHAWEQQQLSTAAGSAIASAAADVVSEMEGDMLTEPAAAAAMPCSPSTDTAMAINVPAVQAVQVAPVDMQQPSPSAAAAAEPAAPTVDVLPVPEGAAVQIAAAVPVEHHALAAAAEKPAVKTAAAAANDAHPNPSEASTPLQMVASTAPATGNEAVPQVTSNKPQQQQQQAVPKAPPQQRSKRKLHGDKSVVTKRMAKAQAVKVPALASPSRAPALPAGAAVAGASAAAVTHLHAAAPGDSHATAAAAVTPPPHPAAAATSPLSAAATAAALKEAQAALTASMESLKALDAILAAKGMNLTQQQQQQPVGSSSSVGGSGSDIHITGASSGASTASTAMSTVQSEQVAQAGSSSSSSSSSSNGSPGQFRRIGSAHLKPSSSSSSVSASEPSDTSSARVKQGQRSGKPPSIRLRDPIILDGSSSGGSSSTSGEFKRRATAGRK